MGAPPAGFTPGSDLHPPHFVIEADESDGSLREFCPHYSIVLNIDEEHLDYYANLEAIYREFDQFARQTREALVFCADDARLADLFARHPRDLSYGYHSLAPYRVQRAACKPPSPAAAATHFGNLR